MQHAAWRAAGSWQRAAGSACSCTAVPCLLLDTPQPPSIDTAAGPGRLYPEEISAYVLANLIDAAQKFTGRPVTKAVVSVPAYFNDEQVGTWRYGGLRAVCSGDLQHAWHQLLAKDRTGESPPACPGAQQPCLPLLTWCAALTPPACLLQREATITAGRIAGLEKIRIIRCDATTADLCSQTATNHHRLLEKCRAGEHMHN